EEEDVADQFLCVLHLFHAQLAELRIEPFEAPVAAHLAREEVLVDGRELDREVLIEALNNALFCLHRNILFLSGMASAPVVSPSAGHAALRPDYPIWPEVW